ncbi:MAG: hypothetical protein CMK09_00080 [Ponticaulis sp.]|nr:hypothetical protein [Ponticaulis sp.]|tara:strand:+ start:37268 stop:37987 length:720 start_codon:yes stop_codon:yes gene_type:complete
MSGPGDDITVLDGERGKSRDQIILEDIAKERAGASTRITRFTDTEDNPELKEKKKREAQIRRVLTALQKRLLDPEYKRLFDKANASVNRAQDTLNQAIDNNEAHIADLERRAVKLTDGRMVFICEDGSGQTKDGDTVTRVDMARLYVPDDATTLKEYSAATKRRSDLAKSADQIEAARTEINDRDNPASKERLTEIERDMRDKRRQLEETPIMRNTFSDVATSKSRVGKLDLSTVPQLQ